jgi:hypothetical protein
VKLSSAIAFDGAGAPFRAHWHPVLATVLLIHPQGACCAIGVLAVAECSKSDLSRAGLRRLRPPRHDLAHQLD